MNESMWDGLIEVLRPNESTITATARLWRRDDLYGTDWGGQLEIPVALRRALPPGEYTLVLSDGAQATAFIGLGPSNSASTFPTVTGSGSPPFGGAPVEATATNDDATLDSERRDNEMSDEQTQPATATPEAAPAAPANGTAPALEVAAPAAEPVAAAPISAEPAAAPISAEPTPVATAAAEAAVAVEVAPEVREPTPVPQLLHVEPRVQAPGHEDGILQTEALARAFLAAVEARQRLDALIEVQGGGFERHLLTSLRAIVHELSGQIETRLRGQGTTGGRWPQYVATLGWAGAVLGETPDRADLRDLARPIGHLVGLTQSLTMEPLRRSA